MARKTTGLGGRIETVDLEPLEVDPSYQRDLKAHHKRIAQSFEPEAAGVLVVGERSDGKRVVIDGQQRRAAMLKVGIGKWKAVLIKSSGPRHEATVFKLLNGRDTRRGLNAVEMFQACLVAEDPVALAVVRAAEGAGLRIKQSRGGSPKWPMLATIGTLYRLTSLYGEATVARALKDLATAWPSMDDAMGELVVVSWIMVYGRLGESLDSARMIEAFKTVPPRKLALDSSVSTEGRYSRCQQIIIDRYNRGLPQKRRLRLHKPQSDAA